MKRLFGFVGQSGSGKTTLIGKLIREYARRGIAVGVVKHTHHELRPIASENRGDTSHFIESGAEAAVLASDSGCARRWTGDESFAFEWTEPRALFSDLPDTILIEGFKQGGAWPKICVGRALANVDFVALVRDERNDVCPVAQFGRDDVEALITFLDTIAPP